MRYTNATCAKWEVRVTENRRIWRMLVKGQGRAGACTRRLVRARVLCRHRATVSAVSEQREAEWLSEGAGPRGPHWLLNYIWMERKGCCLATAYTALRQNGEARSISIAFSLMPLYSFYSFSYHRIYIYTHIRARVCVFTRSLYVSNHLRALNCVLEDLSV